MRIVEIFTSVQGEGPMVGALVTFVRLAGCNAHCDFCDTKRSWSEYIDVSPTEVEAAIKRKHPMRVVFTGGEPTLQMKELEPLVTRLRSEGYHVALETNGIIDDYDITNFDLVVVSPKVTSEWDKWLNKPVVLKFVVSDENADQVFTWVMQKKLTGVYFMPYGDNVEEILENSLIIIEAMSRYEVDGFLGMRYHYFLGVR
jgi:organic radical activating enzyme